MIQRRDSVRPACKDFEEDLVLYYYGDCAGPERDRVEQHLKECLSCRRFLQDLRTFLPLMIRPKERPQAFWDGYYTELQKKLAAMEDAEPWWKRLFSSLHPWTVPALGTALILILALTLTFTKGMWRPQGDSTEEKVPREIRAVTSDLDFFEAMDLLESLDLLETVEGTRSGGGSVQRL